ncbi:MAG: AAA family ATPase [Bacteroidales bacterium]|nr:AAA family ATPase [Bacteroidales bacterium]
MFDKNDEIDKYLNARGKVVLNACPGSGKTTSIAYKLQTLTKEITDENSKFSGVACLSFTNIAKDEINQKFKSFSGSNLKYPHIVSTIDSFINHYIVLPHYFLLNSNIKRPIIFDNSFSLDDFDLPFLFRYKIGKRLIRFSYPPSSIQITKGNSFLSNGNKPNLTGNNFNVFNEYCNTLKKWQELYAYLFAKYMDGNVKTKKEIPEGYKYVNPELKQPGYGEDWYRRIIKETGDHFKMK